MKRERDLNSCDDKYKKDKEAKKVVIERNMHHFYPSMEEMNGLINAIKIAKQRNCL